jgi:hypothetical protein
MLINTVVRKLFYHYCASLRSGNRDSDGGELLVVAVFMEVILLTLCGLWC